MFSQNLTLLEALESVARINEGLKRTKFDGAFCIKFRLLVDTFLQFFAKRKWVAKMIHQKKNRGHRAMVCSMSHNKKNTITNHAVG